MAFLARVKKRYRFHIANFCVMGNHVHLLIQPCANENLSAIMRWLLGGFAKAYNRKHGLSGHFWGDRFHSRVLDGIRKIAIAFGYIDDNPVKAGLVSHISDWRHSGAWHAYMHTTSILDWSEPWMVLFDRWRERTWGFAKAP